jgi:hypothetical protein
MWKTFFSKIVIFFVKKFDKESFMYSFVSNLKNNTITQSKSHPNQIIFSDIYSVHLLIYKPLYIIFFFIQKKSIF